MAVVFLPELQRTFIHINVTTVLYDFYRVYGKKHFTTKIPLKRVGHLLIFKEHQHVFLIPPAGARGGESDVWVLII